MPSVPTIVSDFTPIYVPGADAFPGPDSQNIKAGERRESWIANDHTVIRGRDGRWHAFGIVAPATSVLHEGEWQAFHAASPPVSLREAAASGPWEECPKVLPPAQRPGERRELRAPFIIERGGVYHLFYGPVEMRLAVSENLYRWTPQGACFAQEGSARDPWIVEIGGAYHMVYAAGDSVWLRTSADLRAWSGPEEIFPMRRPGAPESPMLVERDGWFYLFWTIYDGQNGPYDNRTFVYVSRTPDDFREAKELPMLLAHAPELLQDETGQWFITSVEWPRRGVSIARLEWKD